MNKIILSVILTGIFFTGCNSDNVTYSRNIQEVKIDANDIGDASMKLINMADMKTFFDIPKAGTYWIDLGNSYNIQLGTKDGINDCYLLNGYKTIKEAHKKVIKIKCSPNLMFPSEIVLSPKYKVQLRQNSLSNWTSELFKIDNFKGAIGFSSGQLLKDYVAGKSPLSRGFGMLAFQVAPTNTTFNDAKEAISNTLLDFGKAINATSITVDDVGIPDGSGYDDTNMFNIGVSFSSPLYIGTPSLLNILSDYILPIFGLEKPTNFPTENFWDLKSKNYRLIITLVRGELLGDDFYIEIKLNGEEFGTYLDGATFYGTDTTIPIKIPTY